MFILLALSRVNKLHLEKTYAHYNHHTLSSNYTRAYPTCRAFPHGIQSDVYFPLLTILEPELSDRHLASVIAALTDKEYSQVLNDIYHEKRAWGKGLACFALEERRATGSSPI